MNLLSRIRTLAAFGRCPSSELPEVAETVAIIMDGNGRWARRRGLADGRRAPRRHARAAPHRRGGDRPRDPAHGRLRVLDRELVAPAGRGRRADGALRRDDRARAARSRGAGRARALHRPPRPRAGGAAPADGVDGGPHRAEHPARSLDRLRLRRARRARRGDAADRGERARPARDRRERACGPPVRAGAARPGSADPHERRAPHLELHAVAAGLRRARVRRPPVAGFRRARPARGARGVREAPPPVRRS